MYSVQIREQFSTTAFWLKLFVPLCLGLALGACSTQTVKSTTVTPMVVDTAHIPEDELLDISIAILDPGLDDIPAKREELTFADVRIAETQFVAWHLAQTLQRNGNWGIVRVNPNDLSSSDVAVQGTIIQSDGETMILEITVRDATNRTWFKREYTEAVSKYNYDPRMRRTDDPFQGLYNRIANDILSYRQRSLKRDDLLAIRTVARIQFARSFAPQAFDDYLRTERNGRISMARLPAANDPLLTRIDVIRERDYMFVDALQDYYTTFARQMQAPYNEFRRISYDEVMKYDALRAKARRNMILGVATIVGGVAAVQSDNAAVRYGAYGGLFGGGFLIKDAFNTRDEAQMHVEALAELGNSMQAEIAPKTIALEERVITLTGSVEEQYAQWREILADMYAEETGIQAPRPAD